MKRISHLKSFPQTPQRTVLTIGNFDGLHIGHQELIKETIRLGKKEKLSTVALSFSPHPIEVLYPHRPFFRLFPLSDLEERFDFFGVDYLVIQPFDGQLAQLDPELFWREWVQPFICPAFLVVGHDFGFGSNRSGNLFSLQRLAQQNNFELVVVLEKKEGDRTISSSRIKLCIQQGKMEEATKMLGRPYEIRGTIVYGRRLGRELGFPTANLSIENKLVMPHGVYFTQSQLEDGDIYPSITNVGLVPTVKPFLSSPQVETHLLEDFNKEIYQQQMRLKFYRFWREEKKFSSQKELVRQIQLDVKEAQSYWKNKKKKEEGGLN